MMRHQWTLLILSIVFVVGLSVIGNHARAAESIPFEKSRWTSLAYRKIPANEVRFGSGALQVLVRKSAGPLVYKLDKPVKVEKFKVRGEVIGSKTVEGGEFDEDSFFRLGLVVVGDNRLSGIKKMFAAEWIKTLFALAPENAGLDKIYFYNASNRPQLVGRKRQHPSSEFIHETVISHVESDTKFEMVYELDKPLETAALWVSIDGDESNSSFQVQIDSIELN